MVYLVRSTKLGQRGKQNGRKNDPSGHHLNFEGRREFHFISDTLIVFLRGSHQRHLRTLQTEGIHYRATLLVASHAHRGDGLLQRRRAGSDH